MMWNRIRSTDPLGRITTSVFDTTNRLAATIDPLGQRTSFSYDLRDELIRVTDPLGHIATTVFDNLLTPVASVDPLLN